VVKKRFGGEEKRVRQRGRRADDIMEDTFAQEKEEVYDTHTDTYYDFIDRTGLFKAMAAKEAEGSTPDSSAPRSPEPGSSEQDSSDRAPSDRERVATLTPPSSNRNIEPASPEQKKSGRSRS
jgi:hypothetical protein